MLHLSGGIGQARYIRDLHQLESAFGGDRRRHPPPEKEHHLGFGHPADQLIYLARPLKILLYEVGYSVEFLGEVLALMEAERPGSTDLEREEVEGGHHIGEGLGRGDRHLRARVKICAASARPGNGRPDHIDHAPDQAALELHFAYRTQRVRRLT